MWSHHQQFQINQNIYLKVGVHEVNTKYLEPWITKIKVKGRENEDVIFKKWKPQIGLI